MERSPQCHPLLRGQPHANVGSSECLHECQSGLGISVFSTTSSGSQATLPGLTRNQQQTFSWL